MVNGRVIVPAPAFTPPQYGLLSVASDMTAQFPKNWEAGIIWQPLCAAGGTTYDECLVVTGVGAVPEPPAKAPTFENERRAATPFTVLARKDCSAPTYWNNALQEVAEGLTESEAFEVERAFWTGSAGGQQVVFPHLAANAALVVDGDTLQLAADEVNGAALDIVEALGRIEQELADCYRGLGVIHVPPVLVPQLAADMLLVKDGSRYRTPNGNLIAIGNGYTGSSPAGAVTAGTAWMYATGAMFYARSEIRQATRIESFDRDNNTLEQLGERTYVVGWDCCLLAVPVDTARTTR